MLLFSSHSLTMPRVCLWILVFSIQIACLYAFDILTHNAAVHSPPSPSSSSYLSKHDTSLPRKRRIHIPDFLLMPPASTKASLSSRPPSLDTSVESKERYPLWNDAAIVSDSSKLFSQASFSNFRPKASPLPFNTITNNHKDDIIELENIDEPWTRLVDTLRSTAIPTKDMTDLDDYLRNVDEIDSQREASRRRLKMKGQLRRGSKLNSRGLNGFRLNKMAEVKAMALSKSPAGLKNSQSIKSRRAGYFIHKQSYGNPETEAIKSLHGSFAPNYNGGFDTGNFVLKEKPRLFQGFEMSKGDVLIPEGTGAFIVEPYPVKDQVDFFIDDDDAGFLSPLPSSPSSSTRHHRFSQFSPKPKHNSFGSFLNLQPPTRQPTVSMKGNGGFGFFPSSAPDSIAEGFPASNGHGSSRGFSGSFGGFQQDEKDCATITTKTCRSSKDCSCNGFYSCFGSRCILKQGVKETSHQSDEEDPIGGQWHEAPVLDSGFHDFKPLK